MPYTTNPHMSRVRMDAVRLVRSGWSQARVSRYLGYKQGTISKWIAKAPRDGRHDIPTKSSRPHHSPRSLPEEKVKAIVKLRRKYKRCAEVIQEELLRKGVVVSLSSVKRTLGRRGLTKQRSPWKRAHDFTPRPEPVNPGDLVEVDTIHVVCPDGSRFYIYTLLDVYSRWAYAKVVCRISAMRSTLFVIEAQRKAPFQFSMIQTDHGSEFSIWFTQHIRVPHRHTRVRQPNDNSHLERFNRTLQEECFAKVWLDPVPYQKALGPYLRYYNGRRLHMGIQFKTPLETIPSY